MNIGSFVEVLDDTIRGHIVKMKGKTITILTEDGFELTFFQSELVKIEKEKNTDFRFSNFDEENQSKDLEKRKKQPQKREKKTPPMEVDLHIHQLVNSTKNMTNYDMLTLQLETARKKIEFAIEKRIQRIVFIHGVGEGVLRTELEYLLGRYPVKYYDADYSKYGIGATEVYIFQNENSKKNTF